MSNYSYKERINPTNAQIELLMSNIHNARALWNMTLDYCNTELETNGSVPNLTKLSKLLTLVKQTPEYSWLNESESTSLQMVLKNITLAFDSMFKGIRRKPRFKSRKYSKKSFTIRVNDKLVRDLITGDKIILPKIGPIKVSSGYRRLSRFKGRAKYITITLAPNNKWYMSVIVDTSLSGRPTTHTIKDNNTIGLDFGIKTSVIDNQGNSYHNPKSLTNNLKRLSRLQRKLSRANKDSNNYQKLRGKIANLHFKIANSRKDWQHKVALDLVLNNDVIVLETLDIQSMMKKLNSKKKTKVLARNIADEAWFQLKSFIKYKAGFYNRHVLEVSQFFSSSKICSHCGNKNNRLTLSTREWICKCGISHDRDKNAAKNLHSVGEYFKSTGVFLYTDRQYIETLHTI